MSLIPIALSILLVGSSLGPMKMTAASADPLTIVNATQTHYGVAAHKGDYNYLRAAPDRHAAIIEKMHEDTPFKVVAFASGGSAEKGYYQVILNDGTEGWTAAMNVRSVN